MFCVPVDMRLQCIPFRVFSASVLLRFAFFYYTQCYILTIESIVGGSSPPPLATQVIERNLAFCLCHCWCIVYYCAHFHLSFFQLAFHSTTSHIVPQIRIKNGLGKIVSRFESTINKSVNPKSKYCKLNKLL